jgi:microcystin-dependent protein
MSQPFIGQLMLASWGFAAKGWAQCNGQLLPINQNQALFSLLGTTFGGNGTTNFALPNLQGRTPVGTGNGFVLGQIAGEVNHTLTISEAPQHIHTLNAASGGGNATAPAGALLAGGGPSVFVAPTQGNLVPVNGASISNYGGSQPHPNMQPYLVMNWCIALIGIFPSQN